MTSKGLQRRWRQQDVSGGVYGIKFVLGFSLVMVPLGLYVALFGLFLLVRGHVFGLTMPLTAGAITWNGLIVAVIGLIVAGTGLGLLRWVIKR